MSVTALRPPAPLRLLHPHWCEGGPSCADGVEDVIHRVTHTSWEAGDMRITLGLIRYDEARFIDGQRQEVDSHGGPAPEPGGEAVELTMTDTASCHHDGSRIRVEFDLKAADLRMYIALCQQELERLERGPLGRDFPRGSEPRSDPEHSKQPAAVMVRGLLCVLGSSNPQVRGETRA